MRRATAPAAAGVFICAAALVAGCASTQVGGLLDRRPDGLPAAAEIAATPFFAQEDYQCGPAALAMVLTHAGRAATPEALAPQVYLPARKGSLQAEMLATARRHQLVAYPLAPQLEDLLREIAAGNPGGSFSSSPAGGVAAQPASSARPQMKTPAAAGAATPRTAGYLAGRVKGKIFV